MRPASFWSSTGEAFAAKWLHANDRANLIAVHIEISNFRIFTHPIDAAIEAAMQTHG